MASRISFLACLIQLVVIMSSIAQQNNYYLKIFNIQDGLPNNHVKWVSQDNTGFLWIGTWDGLARYDGVEFRIYRHNPNDTNSLIYFDISKILIDSANNVWIRGGDMLCRYLRNHDHFKYYKRSEFTGNSYDSLPVTFNLMELDQSGNLVILVDKDLYKYDISSDKFIKINIPKESLKGIEYSIYKFDKQGVLWFFNLLKPREYGTALRFKTEDGLSYQLVDSVIIFQKQIEDFLTCARIHHCSSGNSWISSNRGLYHLEQDTFRLFHGQIPHGEFLDEQVVLWYDPGGGLMIYHPQEKHQDTIFIPDDHEIITNYYFDDQQNIWFCQSGSGLENSGLGIAYRTGKCFNHYLTKENPKHSYVIFALLKDSKGNIWAGGRPNDHLVKIAPDRKTTLIPTYFDQSNRNDLPRNMTEDLQGNIWLTCYPSGLYKIDPGTYTITDVSCLPVFMEFPEVFRIFRLVKYLGNNKVAVTGGNKLTLIDLSENQGENLWLPEDPFSVYSDNNRNIWLGLKKEVFRTNVDLTERERFSITDITYNVEDICPGETNDLWLALLGGGICHFYPETGNKTFYSTFNGLAHNTVYNILKDKSGNLWVSHDLGISLFNPLTERFINFYEKDGLQIREFNSEAAFQTEEGEMIFGGVGGIVCFFPDSVKRSRIASPAGLVISEFRISNAIFMTDFPLEELQSVKLPKGTDNFQIGFVRPDYRYGDEISYRYLLQGSQENWTVTDSRHRMVNYTSLRPGKYKFIVESTGLEGDWSHKTSLALEIPKFIYQTVIFKVFLVFLFLSLILLFFLMKLKQTRLKERKKQEQLKLETLRGQMNPHFIYNSLNSINYFISKNDRLNANQYISDFSRLMRAIMTNSSQDYISLESEMQMLKDYLELEHLRFSDKFNYIISVEESIDLITMEITPSLVQPFIENAIWHGLRYLEGRKGFLSVRFLFENENRLVCYVEDDGIGRKLSVKLKTNEQKKRRSRGIAIVEERLVIINSFLKTNYSVTLMNLWEDREESGTKVRIEIPFRKPL